MSQPPVEYFHVYDVETLSHYSIGGYHPIKIDDVFVDRYRILHKLGHGTYSTIWLAMDQKKSNYVAVKVGAAYSKSTEIEILSRLTESAAQNLEPGDDPGLIPVVFDRFTIQGPNGTHPCFVTAPARCSLRAALEASGSYLFQVEVARSLAAQLATALSLVHVQGFAHGDIHLGNLLLRLPACLNNLSVHQLYAEYGVPEREKVLRVDTKAPSTDPGVPAYAVPPIWLGKPGDELTLPEALLTLSDFGVAFRPCDKSRFESYTPIVLRPPEAFFDSETPLTLASDIWSLGCVIFELFAHRSLIDGFLAPQDEIIAQQVQLQGMMPMEWWTTWEGRPKWYDEAGNPLSKPGDLWSWERRVEEWIQAPRRKREYRTLEDDEQSALLKLLRSTLAWKPVDRPDINQVLQSEWVRDWAMPAYRRSLGKPSNEKSRE